MESLLEGMVRRVVREEIAAALGEQPFRLALTLPDAATAVGYSLESIRKAIRNHELVPSYANSKPVIPVEELVRWLRSLPNEPR
jgi:hypothetical protein